MARGNYSARTKDPAKAFISTWNTATTYTGSTANNQIKLPLIATGTYKFTVNWGDSTSNTITVWNQPEVTHTYAAPGTYTVTITGFIKGWDFSGFALTTAALVGDRRKITSITQFGCLRLVTYTDFSVTPIAGAFYGCSNLNLLGVTDIFNLKGCESTFGMFRLCVLTTSIPNLDKLDVSKVKMFRNTLRDNQLFNQNLGNWNVSKGEDFLGLFNGSTTTAPYGSFTNGGSDSIKNWDVSNATNLGQMFYYQINFDQNIGSWNTSKVTNMSFMFSGVAGGGPITPYRAKFNNGGSDSIKNWNVSKVTNMSAMFSGNIAFNQPIGSWDVSSVTNISNMFQCLVFNQPLNNWDVSKVTDMSRMFQYYTNAFNQDLSNWKIPLVTTLVNFNRDGSNPSGWSVINYSNFLIALAAQPLKPNVQLGVNQQYNASAVAARAILTSAPNNWTIIDFGLQP